MVARNQVNHAAVLSTMFYVCAPIFMCVRRKMRVFLAVDGANLAWVGAVCVNLVKNSDARAVPRSERPKFFMARKEPENHANCAHQSHRIASLWYFQCLSSLQRHDATRCDRCGDGKPHTLRFRLAYPRHRPAVATASPRPIMPGACPNRLLPTPRPVPVRVTTPPATVFDRTRGCHQATSSPRSVPTSATLSGAIGRQSGVAQVPISQWLRQPSVQPQRLIKRWLRWTSPHPQRRTSAAIRCRSDGG